MIGLILRRLAHAVTVVFGVSVLVFVITRMVGDPARAMLPLSATDEQRAQYERTLGLDQPIVEQFKDFAGGVLQFDLGRSLWQNRPAIDIIAEALPRTLILVTAGVTLALILSVVFGTIAALKPGSLIDRAVVGLSVLGLSAPQFWMGLMLVILLGVTFPIFPTSGSGTPAHLVLPAITMALPQTGRLSMMVRSSMLESLGSDYMKTLELKGLPTWRRVIVHGWRNAAPPVVTIGAWEYVQGLAGYAVVVETVFAWPGMGYTALQAIENQDLTLLSALVLVTAVLVVLINMIVDVGYRWLDPRTEVGGRT
ncbi:ABC transporter permease [Aeromicrobium sp.]|uniref:ABC transporter permease n=1 Tax=Aeromicrobium sp. TaxID=1871063 RepID=UPI0028B00D76|nr:ABC transporter permease [Aeromicrobium sp.]